MTDAISDIIFRSDVLQSIRGIERYLRDICVKINPDAQSASERTPHLSSIPDWMRMITTPPLGEINNAADQAPAKVGPADIYPNPALTPGVTNPQVTQDTIAQTIGTVGWTATIRPPVSTTSIIKAHIMQRDNLPGPASLYELDHFISLELGGHPSDLGNLWCQKYSASVPDGGAHQKDQVENWLKTQVVTGAMTLTKAQEIITTDWYDCYKHLHTMGLLPMMVEFDPSGSSDEDDDG